MWPQGPPKSSLGSLSIRVGGASLGHPEGPAAPSLLRQDRTQPRACRGCGLGQGTDPGPCSPGTLFLPTPSRPPLFLQLASDTTPSRKLSRWPPFPPQPMGQVERPINLRCRGRSWGGGVLPGGSLSSHPTLLISPCKVQPTTTGAPSEAALPTVTSRGSAYPETGQALPQAGVSGEGLPAPPSLTAEEEAEAGAGRSCRGRSVLPAFAGAPGPSPAAPPEPSLGPA